MIVTRYLNTDSFVVAKGMRKRSYFAGFVDLSRCKVSWTSALSRAERMNEAVAHEVYVQIQQLTAIRRQQVRKP